MQERFAGVVAVDGPSGSGKSTVCRRVAAALGAHYLDTGAMYRAVTLAVVRAGVNSHDLEAVTTIAAKIVVEPKTDPADPAITMDGERVDTQIRGSAVTRTVSTVAAAPGVRQLLIAQQQEIIARACADHEYSAMNPHARLGIVVEGRDIAAVVAPDAMVKVHLTASEQARAARRHTDRNGETAASHAETQADIARRDQLDSPVTDPLRPAPGAVTVDTTTMSIDNVVQYLLRLVHAHERSA